jgi:hypothetical protein
VSRALLAIAAGIAILAERTWTDGSPVRRITRCASVA